MSGSARHGGLPEASASDAAGRVELTADWAADDPRAVRLTGLSGRLGGEAFQLAAPARIAWTDGLTLEPVAVHSAAGHYLTIEGHIARHDEQGLVIEAVASTGCTARWNCGARCRCWARPGLARLPGRGPHLDPRPALHGA